MMIPYFIVFGILAVFSLLDIFDGGRELKNRVVLFFFVILFLFTAFRAGDKDYENYVTAFHESTHVDIFDKESMQGMMIYYMEPGFRLLNKAVSSVTDNSFFIFAITAFFALFLNFKTYRKYSPYILLTVLLYFGHTFLLREMIQIRSGLACAICLYSISYIEKRQWGAFLLAVALAGMFHTVAWVFLLVYPFYELKLRRIMLVILAGLSLVLALFFPFGQLLCFLPSIPLFEKVVIYTGDQSYNQPLGVFTNPMILKNMMVMSIGLYFYDSLSKSFSSFRLLFSMFFFGTCWLLVFNDFSIIAARVATFFTVSEVILIPMFLFLLRDNLFHRLLFWSVIVAYCFVTLSLNLYSGNVLPYHLSLFGI